MRHFSINKKNWGEMPNVDKFRCDRILPSQIKTQGNQSVWRNQIFLRAFNSDECLEFLKFAVIKLTIRPYMTYLDLLSCHSCKHVSVTVGLSPFFWQVSVGFINFILIFLLVGLCNFGSPIRLWRGWCPIAVMLSTILRCVSQWPKPWKGCTLHNLHCTLFWKPDDDLA